MPPRAEGGRFSSRIAGVMASILNAVSRIFLTVLLWLTNLCNSPVKTSDQCLVKTLMEKLWRWRCPGLSAKRREQPQIYSCVVRDKSLGLSHCEVNMKVLMVMRVERSMNAGDGGESCRSLLTQAPERGKSWHLLSYVPFCFTILININAKDG